MVKNNANAGQSALPPGNPDNPDMKIRRGAVKVRARCEEMPMKQIWNVDLSLWTV